MRSLKEAVDERLTEIESEREAENLQFATWLSHYIAEQEEAEVDPALWEIRATTDETFYPSFRVDRFVVETAHGWALVEPEAIEEADATPDDTDEEDADSEADEESVDAPSYVYAEAPNAPEWVIYAWKAYSGEKYAVESHNAFLDACVSASELGPYT